MLSINCVCTLMLSLLTPLEFIWFRGLFSHGVVAIIVAQAKERLYHNWFQIDMFLPLAIKVFGCQ